MTTAVSEPKVNRYASIDDVCRAWASRCHTDGHCGNVSFREGYLCDVFGCIAEIIDNPSDGKGPVAIVCRTNHGDRETKHQESALAAVSHMRTIVIPFLIGFKRDYIRFSWAIEICDAQNLIHESKTPRLRAERTRQLIALVELANRHLLAKGRRPFPVPTDSPR